MPKFYDNLSTQIVTHLTRNGPMSVSRLIMNLRHNGNAATIRTALADTPGVYLFVYSFTNDRNKWCQHQVARLDHQTEAEYDADAYGPGNKRPPRKAPKTLPAARAEVIPAPATETSDADQDFDFL